MKISKSSSILKQTQDLIILYRLNLHRQQVAIHIAAWYNVQVHYELVNVSLQLTLPLPVISVEAINDLSSYWLWLLSFDIPKLFIVLNDLFTFG